jgi:hypothetical protein
MRVSAAAPQPRLAEPVALAAAVLVAVVAAAFGASEERALLLAVFAVAAALSLCGTALALPAYLATTFGNPPPIPGVEVSGSQLAAAMLLLAAGADAWRGLLRPRWSIAASLLVLFTVYVLVSSWFLRPPGLPYYYQPGFYLVIALVTAARAWDAEWRHRVLGALFAVSCLYALGGVYEKLTGTDLTWEGATPVGSWHRINGLSRDAIQFAFLGGYALLAGGYLIVSLRSRVLRCAVAAGCALLAYSILITLNRQTPLVLAVAGSVFLVLCRSRLRPWLLAGGLAAALLAAPVFGPKIAGRFSRVTVLSQDHSLAIRHDKLLIAAEVVKAHPWLGLGNFYFHTEWIRYRPRGGMVVQQYQTNPIFHMDLGYVQLLTEHGIVGTVLWFAMAAAMALAWWRTRWWAALTGDAELLNATALVAALLVQMLVTMVVSAPHGAPRALMLWGLLLALDGAAMAARESAAA